MYKNNILSISLFIMIALLISATLLSTRTPIPTFSPAPNVPDAYMEDVSALILNKQGKPSMRIISPKMVHYANQDTTDLITPELTLYRQSPQPWHITSDFAKATQGIENVTFTQNVVVHHPADQNNPATLIKTMTLLVRPNEQTAETHDLITMTQPNTVIKAIGMMANMNTGEIKLLSQARGEYVPNY